MASFGRNSLDLLRLVAATLVLYSHQYALLGMPEPSFFGWNSFGGAGVTVFFFLSGYLVWLSWERDPDRRRFFVRRSLRIFPALWMVVLLSVFVLGPFFSTLTVVDYFTSSVTWRYLATGLLVSTNTLPGVFSDNAFPLVVNGSLWTLPVEFLCYVSVAVVGYFAIFTSSAKGLYIGLSLVAAVFAATYMPSLIGSRFSPHLEMVAMFWWGVTYGYYSKALWKSSQERKLAFLLSICAFLAFLTLGPRGFERSAMLVFSGCFVHLALKVSTGARLTEYFGDLSYGVYIWAFPVQQAVVQLGRGQDWRFGTFFFASLMMTLGLAYLSWHLVEKTALRFKPAVKLP